MLTELTSSSKIAPIIEDYLFNMAYDASTSTHATRKLVGSQQKTDIKHDHSLSFTIQDRSAIIKNI
jgi:hypothetical protein